MTRTAIFKTKTDARGIVTTYIYDALNPKSTFGFGAAIPFLMYRAIDLLPASG
ncbi:MAG TPA: hypothetical protein VLI55_10390 [Bryobacteraceae bacterium]|nr:hypothetical protein [Bryobacteraceae bacterium]